MIKQDKRPDGIFKVGLKITTRLDNVILFTDAFLETVPRWEKRTWQRLLLGGGSSLQRFDRVVSCSGDISEKASARVLLYFGVCGEDGEDGMRRNASSRVVGE